MSARRIPVTSVKPGDRLLYLGQEYPIVTVSHIEDMVFLKTVGRPSLVEPDHEHVWIVDREEALSPDSDVVYPETDELFFWWLCYRKIGYATESLALTAAAEYESTVPYLCPYGPHLAQTASLANPEAGTTRSPVQTEGCGRRTVSSPHWTSCTRRTLRGRHESW